MKVELTVDEEPILEKEEMVKALEDFYEVIGEVNQTAKT